MKDKIKILLRDGTYTTLKAWQEKYGLGVGSTSIGRYFSYTEQKFQENIADYGELIVCEPLMHVLDRYRELKGSPVSINSFNRSEQAQQELKKKEQRAATISPHVVKMAADCDTPNPEQLAKLRNYKDYDKLMLRQAASEIVRDNAKLIKKAAMELDIMVRLGFEDYIEVGYTFVHVDVCPEYYAVGKPFHHHEHPKPWEYSISW